MSIHILGIRRKTNEKTGKEKSFEVFKKEKFRAPSVADLFANIDTYLKSIPTKEQYNLYYTCADASDTDRKKFESQAVLPFDIDSIDVERIDLYVELFLTFAGLDPAKTGTLFSGHGLQFIVGLLEPITDTKFFDEHRIYYKTVCKNFNAKLKAAGLPGKLDEAVFTRTQLMRLPGTLNKKPGRPSVKTQLIQATIEPVDFSLFHLAGIPVPKSSEQLSSLDIKNYSTPDTKGILSQCDFLTFAATEPESVPENLWYAMLSITGRLEKGNEISHQLSKGHPGYTVEETDAKINQALQTSGPRTCENINALWGRCSTCKHFGKIKSPILIKSEDYIATEKTGFHRFTFAANGAPKPPIPECEDLRRYFEREQPYVTLARTCYTFNGKYWETREDAYLETYAYNHFRPFVKPKILQEFSHIVRVTNTRGPEWFENTTRGKINFQNGILDLSDKERKLSPHSSEYGFRYVLPYSYDPAATAPRFEKFLEEVTQGQKDYMNLLLEYAGYIVSNDDCWAAKALLLTGEGKNGKSVFMRIMQELVGSEFYSVLNMGELSKETNRYQLEGKFLNYSEETPRYALMESSTFKNLVSGGMMQVRALYKMPYKLKNKCKFIFACNELPMTRDSSDGLMRRLIIAPFNAVFSGENRDVHLVDKLVAELPGIFNLALAGHERLSRQKDFTYVKLTEDALLEYQETMANDCVSMFFEDCVTIHEGLDRLKQTNLTMTKLYGEYSLFEEAHGGKPINYNYFSKKLRKIIPDIHERLSRKKIGTMRERILLGVTLGASDIGNLRLAQ